MRLGRRRAERAAEAGPADGGPVDIDRLADGVRAAPGLSPAGHPMDGQIIRADRERLLADPSLTGAAFCRAYAARADAWLVALLGEEPGVALVAVGGYGRGELAPGSDLDVVLLHAGRKDVRTVAERLWYPLWDAGLKVGHGVRTIKEALRLAADDLDTATALLDLRLIAGDTALA